MCVCLRRYRCELDVVLCPCRGRHDESAQDQLAKHDALRCVRPLTNHGITSFCKIRRSVFFPSSRHTAECIRTSAGCVFWRLVTWARRTLVDLSFVLCTHGSLARCTTYHLTSCTRRYDKIKTIRRNSTAVSDFMPLGRHLVASTRKYGEQCMLGLVVIVPDFRASKPCSPRTLRVSSSDGDSCFQRDAIDLPTDHVQVSRDLYLRLAFTA